MKIPLTFTLLLLSALYSCQKTNQDAFKPLFSGQQLEGKWYWVRSIIALKFDDGSTQNVDVNGMRSEWIDFQPGERHKNESETGFITKGGDTGDASGDWVLLYKDYELNIHFSLPDGYVYMYRTIDEITNTKLVISANDAQVLRQYEENNLVDFGDKKLVGGTILEEYER